MSKYINRALLFTEKRTMLWSMAAYALLYIVCLFQTFVDIHSPAVSANGIQLAPEPPYLLVNVLYLCFVAVAVAAVFDSYLDKHKKYSFMLSQPFSRDSIIITKSVSFLISFMIPTVIYGFIAYILLLMNPNYYGSYYGIFSYKLLLTLLGLTAVLTFITMFAQLMQMFFGKAIAGVIFPVIIYFMLFFSLNVGGSFISKRIGVLRNAVDYINSFIFNNGVSFVNSTEFQSASIYAMKYIENPKAYISIILLAAAVFIFYMSLLLNRKINSENTSSLFIFKFSQTIFNVTFSLAFTIIGSLMISGALYYLYSAAKDINFSTYLINTYGLSSKETIEQNLYLVLNIIWVPLYFIVYKVFTRFTNARRAA